MKTRSWAEGKRPTGRPRINFIKQLMEGSYMQLWRHEPRIEKSEGFDCQGHAIKQTGM